MTLADCIKELINGRRIRRYEWPEDGTHIKLVDEKLMIWKLDDKRYHPLIVSLGDMEASDWDICEGSSGIVS